MAAAGSIRKTLLLALIDAELDHRANSGDLLRPTADARGGDRAARSQLDEFSAQFCSQRVVERDERFIAIEHTRGSPRSHASNVRSKSSALIPSDLARRAWRSTGTLEG
jgi:hypothetical protein